MGLFPRPFAFGAAQEQGRKCRTMITCLFRPVNPCYFWRMTRPTMKAASGIDSWEPSQAAPTMTPWEPSADEVKP